MSDVNVPKRVFKEFNKEIRDDEAFWKIIGNMFEVFNRINIDCRLSKAIEGKIIQGLNGIIEEANLQLKGSSVNQQSECGYGSDSSCEMEIEIPVEKTRQKCKEKCYSKKVILATGMRSINIAQFLVQYSTGITKYNTDYMYYETGHAVEKICNLTKKLKLDHVQSSRVQSTNSEIY